MKFERTSRTNPPIDDAQPLWNQHGDVPVQRGVLQASGVNDYDTADMLSKTMGRETITYETGGQSKKDVMVKDPERSLSNTQHLAARNLMDANKIMKLAPDTLLLMRVGENPLIVRKLRYYVDKEFAGMFDADVQAVA